MTKAAIALSVAILAIVVTSSSSVTSSQHAFANGDKCISAIKNGVVTEGDCEAQGKDNHAPKVSGDAKKECRETNDKCSSSQTGFGNFDNAK